MYQRPLFGHVLAILLTAGCGAAASGSDAPSPAPAPATCVVPSQEAPPPVAAEAAAEHVVAAPPDAPEAEGSADIGVSALTPDGADLQARALEAVQEAEELFAAGDLSGAVARADLAYGLMLRLPDDSETTPGGEADDSSASNDQTKQDIRLVVAKLINQVYGGVLVTPAPPASWDLALPMMDNEHVQYEIKSFTKYESKHFFEGYRRSGRFRPMILERLAAAGLPSQISWLPLVESAFKVGALSRASALGLWQFISSTGLRYGLKRDEWVDERLDPIKSTDAAIAYLTDLHRLFGDWPKALAAYNCGEGRIARVQRDEDGRYRDFWDIYRDLPEETRRYVPRLIAAMQIIENPQRYGVALPELEAPLPSWEEVEIDKAVKLSSLDAALGLDSGTLAALNPELRLDSTPARPYTLRVPGALLDAALAAVGRGPPSEVAQASSAAVESGGAAAGGAEAGGGAEAAGAGEAAGSADAASAGGAPGAAEAASPGELAAVEEPASAGEPPDRAAAIQAYVRAALDKIPSYAPPQPKYVVHRVRSGETLSIIAQKYRTSVSMIMRYNQLRSANRIWPGQRLRIPLRG